MTFALIFIANHIDKIHIITNETALLFKGGLGGSISAKNNSHQLFKQPLNLTNPQTVKIICS
ncbi:hypothetical protein BV378_32605 [Nostoc sp. RF31YmG]|nr:hypothetical protein BV378_32605 [Nostoc sp. RF31YmG]OUL20789.1 hypothetical protein BV375_30120 [Nostoc sp. 106C]